MKPVLLVVDDEKDILESLRTFLEGSLDVKVVTTPWAVEGLEILRREEVALILSDFKMPQMDGLQFLAMAYDLKPGVPRVMMTAFPDMELAIRALNQARITQFLVKPIQPDSLLSTIGGLLKEHQRVAFRAEALTRATRLASGRPSPQARPRAEGSG